MTLTYYDREEGTPSEVRAGLTMYKKNGWVAADISAESASRTLDYAFDDSAVAVVAEITGHPEEATFYRERSKNYKNVWMEDLGFMVCLSFFS
jgi:putative alpha-1,2-mannosidase